MRGHLRCVNSGESLLICKGCGAKFIPHTPKQRYHSTECRTLAQKRAARVRYAEGAEPKQRLPLVKGPPVGATFWYQVLDVLHYYQLTLPSLLEGVATIHRKDWLKLFYKDNSGSEAALRAWERFKQKARTAHIVKEDAAPMAYGVTPGTYVLADTSAGYFHLALGASYDGAFLFLGPPHPLGDDAEREVIEREAARSAELIRFAGVLSAVQEKRRASDPGAASSSVSPVV